MGWKTINGRQFVTERIRLNGKPAQKTAQPYRFAYPTEPSAPNLQKKMKSREFRLKNQTKTDQPEIPLLDRGDAKRPNVELSPLKESETAKRNGRVDLGFTSSP